jgi:hypothetical protein
MNANHSVAVSPVRCRGFTLIELANAQLSVAATNTLDISPGLSANNDVVWICGNALVPTPALSVAPPGDASTVPAAYLPTSCHA